MAFDNYSRTSRHTLDGRWQLQTLDYDLPSLNRYRLTTCSKETNYGNRERGTQTVIKLRRFTERNTPCQFSFRNKNKGNFKTARYEKSHRRLKRTS